MPNQHRRKAVRGLPHIRDHDWWPAPFLSFSSLQRPERPAANGRCRRFPPLTRAIATALARPSRKRTPTFLPQSNIAGRCREEDHPGPCPPTWRPRLTLSSLQSSAKFGGGASTASTPSKLEASATSAKFRPVPLLIGGATFIGRVRQLFGSPPGSRSPSGSDDPRRAAAASRRTRTSADDGASRA